jgi:LacI family transcriptional regulator
MVVRQRRWGTIVADKPEIKAGRVGFLVDHFAQDYNFPSGDLIRGMQDALGEEVQLVIAESKSDCEIEIRQLRKFQDQVDGLIFYPTSHPKSLPTIQRFVDSGLPTVILDRLPEGIRTDAVMSDNEGATLKAIRALEERGHRRIGFFSFHKPDFSTVAERHSAYRLALAEVGVEDVNELTRWFPRELDGNPQTFLQAIYDAMFTLLNQKEPITALFCVQDSFAAAALQACDRMGVGIPDNLEIATFNDWPPMMLRTPWCTHRIVPRSYDIGRSAAELLLDRFSGNRSEPKVVRIRADFIIADSGPKPASPFSRDPIHRPTEVM